MLARVQTITEENVQPRISMFTVSRGGQDVMNTESRLWERFKIGDEQAFIDIYNSHVRLLFNYGMKFSKDRDLIQDCIQDFFLYLREKRERLGRTTSIKFYLLRSFRRRLFVYLDKETKHNKQTVDTNEFHLELIDCNINDMIDGEAKADLVAKMNKVMNHLGQKEREALFFYYYQGLSYQEIAEVLGFTHVSSARRLIYTALDNLRVKLRKFK